MTQVLLEKEFLAHGVCPAQTYRLPYALRIIDRFRTTTWAAWQGRWIEVGPPFQPRSWNCDTRRVYPVLDADFNRECGATVVLCEHMIAEIAEVGDAAA